MRGPFSGKRLRRAALVAAISGLALTACSTESALDIRPSVDIGQTAGIQRAPEQTFRETTPRAFEPAVETYAAPQMPAQPDYSAEPNEPGYDETAAMSPAPDLNGGDPADGEYFPQSTVEDEPEPAAQATIRPAVPRQTLLAGFPRVTPRFEPSVSTVEAACRKELKRAGVRFQDLPPIRNGNTCFIDNPVKVSAIGNVEMKPAATLTCQMALTFAKWTNKELVPSARWKYFTGIKAIRQGSSYSCRRIAGSRTPSAHSTGNALDVMAIQLNNGKVIDVRKQGLFAFRARGLLNNVRADGCEYFTTVLGPGYNYDHRNHFHFDLMERKNGRRACH